LVGRPAAKKRLVFADRVLGRCRRQSHDVTRGFLCWINGPDVSMGTTSAGEIRNFQDIMEIPQFILNEC
jgi:hypothetical protein